jgi:hypothetical protein
MTILGKILVVVNLVFSLVTAFLIVTVFATRTNWKVAHEKLMDRYRVADANSRVFAKEAEDARGECDAKVKQLTAQFVTAQNEAKIAKDEARDKATELQTLSQRISLLDGNIKSATEEINRRKLEIENLKTVVAEKDDKMVKIEAQNKQFRDSAVSAEITAKTVEERNHGLLQQEVQLTKEVQNRSSGGGSALGNRPPPDDVRGTVLESDPRNGLVTISIGSDAGLAKDHILQVYRTQPRPEYVGTIKILDAHFHEAVARPVQPLRAGPIQKGDIVSSRIVTSRR